MQRAKLAHQNMICAQEPSILSQKQQTIAMKTKEESPNSEIGEESEEEECDLGIYVELEERKENLSESKKESSWARQLEEQRALMVRIPLILYSIKTKELSNLPKTEEVSIDAQLEVKQDNNKI